MGDDLNSFAHTKRNSKYQIVLAPKYLRKVIYGGKREEIGKIVRELCSWKQATMIEAEVCPDPIHKLVEIPPKMGVLSLMGFLKRKSSLKIHERHGKLKYKHGNRSFWCRGYYADRAGKNAKKIAEHIPEQLKEDRLSDQTRMKESEDLFRGSKQPFFAKGRSSECT